jgi:four helix bundle protein
MIYSQTRIYSRSLELVALTREVMDRLPTGYGFLADQLRRAGASVVLNFAEGAGKATRRERQCYFRRSKASAYEVAAAIDVGVTLGVTPKHLGQQAAEIVDHLGGMLAEFR